VLAYTILLEQMQPPADNLVGYGKGTVIFPCNKLAVASSWLRSNLGENAVGPFARPQVLIRLKQSPLYRKLKLH
jgi:hypothetical protein